MIERLERIEALDRSTADPLELLAELRGLLRDAEAWVRVEGGDARRRRREPPPGCARAGRRAGLSGTGAREVDGAGRTPALGPATRRSGRGIV